MGAQMRMEGVRLASSGGRFAHPGSGVCTSNARAPGRQRFAACPSLALEPPWRRCSLPSGLRCRARGARDATGAPGAVGVHTGRDENAPSRRPLTTRRRQRWCAARADGPGLVSRAAEPSSGGGVHGARRRRDLRRGAGRDADRGSNALARRRTRRAGPAPWSSWPPGGFEPAHLHTPRRGARWQGFHPWSPSTTRTRHAPSSSRTVAWCRPLTRFQRRWRSSPSSSPRLPQCVWRTRASCSIAWEWLGRLGPLAGRLDLSRIGMVGHSLGGAVAAEVLRTDSRVDAAVDLDVLILPVTAARGLDRPFMVINAPPSATLPKSWPFTDGYDRGPGSLWANLRGPRLSLDARAVGAHGLFRSRGSGKRRSPRRNSRRRTTSVRSAPRELFR